ncbi:hypothetical protein RIF29_24321 [Crotalaria pallida]|uniref:Glabrous enhancer-binding protein-like DBD domain-containing protein n=1 Tax=Crotalaria pallida TaxID=3830 RepID=A0AAN9ERR8_CROPI
MASSVQHDTVFTEQDMDNDDDEEESPDDLLEEDEEELELEEEEFDDDVLPDFDDNEPEPDPSPSTSSAALAVTVAVPPPISPAATTTTTVTTTATDSKQEKKPLDDSRRLFQRLWTDEDEIELLQGFLDYTSQRGSSSHHNDTALFYDQIKSKLQLDFNKNQLVEKIRRLKKKYRNVLNKISSGKEFSFKSAHDQATFEISRKIWSNIGQITAATAGGGGGGGVGVGVGVGGVDDNALEEDEINLTPNLNSNLNNSYHSTNPNLNLNLVQALPRYEVVMLGNSGEKKSTPSRKRSRPRSAMMRMDEKPRELFLNDGLGLGSGSGSGTGTGLNLNLNKDHNYISNSVATTATTIATGSVVAGITNNNSNKNYENNCNSVPQQQSSIPGLIEETVRSCLSPVLKELVGGGGGGGGGGVMGGGLLGARGFGIGGFGSLNSIPVVPLGYLGLGSGGEGVDEKWRKQQILELEVYAKRLELVQDQIKMALEELRSTGGG